MTTVTITATGAGSFTVPAGVTSILFNCWAGGGGGGGSHGIYPAGGGAFSGITLTVVPGATVYYSVGPGGGNGIGGTNTWVNISTNAQPTSNASGCYAGGGGSGGAGGAGNGGAGNYGDTNYTGGKGSASASSGGGGGGAGSAANGSNGSGGTGGAGGSPDGGAGGNGGASTGGAGTQPGGGGGGSNGNSGSTGGHGGAGQFQYIYTAAAATPFPNTDFPNPPGSPDTLFNRTHLDALNLNLLGQDTFFAGPGSGPDYDWPNPKGPRHPIEHRTWARSYRLPAYFQPPVVTTFDWPNPKGPRSYTANKIFTEPYKLLLQGQDVFFGLAGNPNFDWPVPKGYRQPIDNKTWSHSYSLPVYFHPPVVITFDWPNPRGYVPGISLKTHLDPLKLTLQGHDLLPFRQLDWPVPKPYRPAWSLKTWVLGILPEPLIPIPFPVIPTFIRMVEPALEQIRAARSVLSQIRKTPPSLED